MARLRKRIRIPKGSSAWDAPSSAFARGNRGRWGSCLCSGDLGVLGGFWIQTCTHNLCLSPLEPSPLTCHPNFTKTHFPGKWSDCHMNLGMSFRATFSRIYSAPGSGHGWCEWHNYRGNWAENEQIWVNVRCIQLLWEVFYTFSFDTQDAWVFKTAQGTCSITRLPGEDGVWFFLLLIFLAVPKGFQLLLHWGRCWDFWGWPERLLTLGGSVAPYVLFPTQWLAFPEMWAGWLSVTVFLF